MHEPSVEEITEAIADAVRAHDFPAVVSLMKMLALRNPDLAQSIYDAMMGAFDGAPGHG